MIYLLYKTICIFSGMHNVKVHKHAGVLSAYGLVLADVVNEQQEAWMKPLNGLFAFHLIIFFYKFLYIKNIKNY